MIDRLVAALDVELIEQQRWFRHKGSAETELTFAGGWVAGDASRPTGAWLFVRVGTGGHAPVYQIPVALVSPNAESGTLGSIHLDQDYELADAAHDPILLESLLSGKHTSVEMLQQNSVGRWRNVRLLSLIHI